MLLLSLQISCNLHLCASVQTLVGLSGTPVTSACLCSIVMSHFTYVSVKDMDRDVSLLCLRVGGRVRKFLLIPFFFPVVFTPLGNN